MKIVIIWKSIFIIKHL